MNTIASLDTEAAADRRLSGSKAASLARLRASGFRVPEGFVVLVGAFRDFLQANGLEEELAALSSVNEERELESHLTRFGMAIQSAALPEALQQELQSAYRAVAGPVAVRSSGIAEDSAQSSFAGAYVSLLNRVGDDAVLDAVRVCWASAFSSRVAAYHLQHRPRTTDWLMGVIVQKMVFADKAGVLFTRDPYGHDDDVLIEAVAGGCDKIVAGAPAELSISVARDTRELNRVDQPLIGTRQFGSGAVGLLSRNAVVAPRLLRRHEINMLLDAALRLESIFEGPQDVEWAFAAGELFLLQSRPLTGRNVGVAWT